MQFLLYFKSIFRAPRPKSAPIVPLVSIFVIFFLGAVYSSVYSLGNIFFSAVASLAFTSGISVFYGCYQSPNLEAAFPLNHKKTLAYRFLSSLFLLLIMIVVVIAVVAIGDLIAWDFTEFVNFFTEIGLYSVLFSLAYTVILYSAGMIAGFIKKRKNRNIFLIVLCITVFIAFVIMAVMYKNDLDAYGWYRPPFLEIYYSQIGLPWLFVTIWFLIAAAMLAWAIYLGVKHYDPKKF